MPLPAAGGNAAPTAAPGPRKSRGRLAFRDAAAVAACRKVPGMRLLVIVGTLLLLGGCAGGGSGGHDFSGAFVGVTGGAAPNR